MTTATTKTRREFLSATITVGAATVAPAIFTSKRSAAQGIMGSGEHRYHFHHQCVALPSQYHWQISHTVAVDPNNHLYVIHEGDSKLTDHPSIFVFDSEGTYIRSFGQQFQGGGHGIEVHVENGEPYLYVAGYQQTKTIAKMTLKGDLIWQHYAPVQSGVYAVGEASNPRKIWGRDRFMPTNFAFLEDEFLLADGYGSFFIHRYDYDGNWKGCFGGPGKGEGTFATPHGIWVDHRDGQPQIVICDRAHNTLQVFTAAGEYVKTVPGFGLPANADTYGDWMVIPELVARVSLVDRHHNTVVTLGDDRERVLADKADNKGFTIRTKEADWKDGKFVHPHDACFDADGNLYVAEWVSTGRITKLTPA